MKYIFSLFLLSTASLNYGMEVVVRPELEAQSSFFIDELLDREEEAAQIRQTQQQESQARIALAQQLATLQQQLAAQQATHTRTSAEQSAQLASLQSSNTWLKWITGGAIAIGGAAWVWNFISVADLKSQVGPRDNGLENRVSNSEKAVDKLGQRVDKIPVIEFRDNGHKDYLYLFVNGKDQHAALDKR